MTKAVERHEILDYLTYEEERGALREAAMRTKDERRVHVGPHLTFLFENHDTIRYQVLEMMRAERMVRDADIRHEIETYNELLGGPGELGCTLLVEIDDPARAPASSRSGSGCPATSTRGAPTARWRARASTSARWARRASRPSSTSSSRWDARRPSRSAATTPTPSSTTRPCSRRSSGRRCSATSRSSGPQESGMRSLFAASHCANVCSCGLSERENARSRAPQYSFSNSALYWNMLPRSSAPGKPKPR